MSERSPPSSDHSRILKQRSMLAAWEKQLSDALGPTPPDLVEFHLTATLPDGHESEMKVVRPKPSSPSSRTTTTTTTTNNHPLILLLHGGAFQSGTTNQLTLPARAFASAFSAVVVSATYRFAPEHPFPTATTDAYATLEWLLTDATAVARLGASPAEAGLVIGGYSAGGNIASVLTALSRERGLVPEVTGTFLAIPHLLAPGIVPEAYRAGWTSTEEFEDSDRFLNGEMLDGIVETMGADVRSRLFSVVNWGDERVVKMELPRTYVQVGRLDSLRDDGVVYQKWLGGLGVQTRLDEFEFGHQAWTVFANEESPKDLGPKSMNAMAWLLGVEEKY